MTNRLKWIAFLVLGPLGVAGTSVPSAAGRSAGMQSNPCELKITPPSGLQAPKNLRIIKGLLDQVEELVSGPAVDETLEPPQSTHAYFDMLSNRADCRVAFGLRSQAEIDSVPTGSEGTYKWDIVYDPVNDAMLQRAKGELNGQKMGLSMEQKQPLLLIKNKSMFLTYDYKIGPGAEYKGEGYLKQYKAYRLDAGGGTELWLSTKLKFPLGSNPPGIAEMLTTGGWYAGPGVTYANSEILEPRVNRFYPRVNTWTRYFLYVEGELGGAAAERTELVYVSIWAADETRDPIQLYNRLPMYSPVADIRRFRFEFNTSETSAVNPLIEIWDRNFVVLTGISPADVKGLLQRPLK